jgi:Holliday junction resolvase-like predicted endonuclease
LDRLSRRLEQKYDLVLKNIPLYSERKRLVGEIDILAVKDDCWDIFEVKCSNRVIKARHQLKRIKKQLSPRIRNSFFFCGESDRLMII